MAERTRRPEAQPVAGRPGTRRVVLPGTPAAGRAPGQDPPGPARRRRRPRFTRRQAWQLVIVLEVVAAVAVSLSGTGDAGTFSLDGVDRARLCPAVQRHREEGAYAASVTVETAPVDYDRQARVYRELAGWAPTDVRPDFEHLAALSDQLAGLARELQARQREDPSFAAGLALVERQAALTAGATRSTGRVEQSISQACGLDLTEPVATTTAPPVGPTTSR